MRDAAGFRSFEWDCEKQGCFNKKKRLDFKFFYSALPGLNSFSDIDGFAEIAGNFCYMEWKEFIGPLPKGQRIAFERRSASGDSTIFCFVGNGSAENFQVSHYAKFFRGQYFDWQPLGAVEIHSLIESWSKWAVENSRLSKPSYADLESRIAQLEKELEVARVVAGAKFTQKSGYEIMELTQPIAGKKLLP